MSSNAEHVSSWRRVRKWLLLLACLAMLVQIVCGIIWTIANFDTIPSFGDTTEYIELSQTMDLDEYRPVLYPLLIRIARNIDEDCFHRYIFSLQLALSLFCMSYAVFVIDTLRSGSRHAHTLHGLAGWLYGGLYLSMIPMVAFMNLTILTDSIANSLLVLMLSVSIQVIYGKELSFGKGVLLAIALIGQCLIRADRLYISLLLLAILAVIAIIRSPNRRRILVSGTACLAILTFAVFSVVSAATQVRGRRGRIQTDLNFILLDRVVWPHMSENYEYFPEEIQNNITLEEAQTFDQHNNNVMYQLAPLLEGRVGREKACEYYREMARIVWKRQSPDVLRDIGECILVTLATPLTHHLAVEGHYPRSNIGWNMHCLSGKTPEWTKTYDRIAFYVTAFMLILGLLVAMLDRILRAYPRGPFVILPFVIASIIICLWYALGDGAPFNDRYMLIVYVTFSLWPLTVWYGKRYTAPNNENNVGRIKP